MADQTWRGSCQCGAVHIEAAGDPEWTATCHCTDCRKATGAAMAAYAGYLRERTTVEGKTFAEYESSSGVFRGFCKECGSRLTYRSSRWPDQMHFHVGALDDANAFAPQVNVYAKEKLDWVVLEPGLPAYETVPSEED